MLLLSCRECSPATASASVAGLLQGVGCAAAACIVVVGRVEKTRSVASGDEVVIGDHRCKNAGQRRHGESRARVAAVSARLAAVRPHGPCPWRARGSASADLFQRGRRGLGQRFLFGGMPNEKCYIQTDKIYLAIR